MNETLEKATFFSESSFLSAEGDFPRTLSAEGDFPRALSAEGDFPLLFLVLFKNPFDHLTALPLLEQWTTENTDPNRRVIVSPDAGRVRLTEKFAGHLGAPIAILHKRRDPTRHNVAETLDVIGDVEGRTAVLIDDMIDTAGTIVGAAALLMERGAERVIACATHPLFSGPAIERLNNSVIERVVVTNTIPLPPDIQMDKLVVLSIAPILASALRAVFEDESVSEIFRGENV